MKNLHTLNVIAVVLLLIGGLNWGLIGLFNTDLVGMIFGDAISRIIFVLIGIAALYRIVCWARCKGK